MFRLTDLHCNCLQAPAGFRGPPILPRGVTLAVTAKTERQGSQTAITACECEPAKIPISKPVIPLARAIYIDDVAGMQDGPTIWQKLLRQVGYYLGATATTFCAVSASAQL